MGDASMSWTSLDFAWPHDRELVEIALQLEGDGAVARYRRAGSKASCTVTGSVALVLVLSLALGLRHATDPDHLAAVTTLIASDRGAESR